MVISQWSLIKGRMEPTEVTFRSEGDRFAINGEAVKGLPIGTILSEHRQKMLKNAQQGADAEWIPGVSGRRKTAIQAALRKRAQQYGSRKGVALSPDGLEAVAQVYRDAYAEGRPVQAAVADAFGIARSTAANRIMLARRAGHDMPNPKETGR